MAKKKCKKCNTLNAGSLKKCKLCGGSNFSEVANKTPAYTPTEGKDWKFIITVENPTPTYKAGKRQGDYITCGSCGRRFIPDSLARVFCRSDCPESVEAINFERKKKGMPPIGGIK